MTAPKQILSSIAILAVGGAIAWFTMPGQQTIDPSDSPLLDKKRKRPVSGEVRSVVHNLGFDHLRDRLKAVNKLSRELSRKDQQRLLDFIKQKRPAEMEEMAWGHLTNDVVNVLRSQKEIHPDLTETLVAIYRDPLQDGLMHDYALQHLGPLHARVDEADQKLVREVLEEALHKNHQDYSATALLWLGEMYSENGKFVLSNAELSSVLQRVLDHSEMLSEVKTKALHFIAERELTAFLPHARQIASDNKAATNMRKAAIAALGAIGGASDQALISSLGSESAALNQAADPALKRLNARHQISQN